MTKKFSDLKPGDFIYELYGTEIVARKVVEYPSVSGTIVILFVESSEGQWPLYINKSSNKRGFTDPKQWNGYFSTKDEAVKALKIKLADLIASTNRRINLITNQLNQCTNNINEYKSILHSL